MTNNGNLKDISIQSSLLFWNQIKIQVCFYSFDEQKLLFENNYSPNLLIKKITEDFINKKKGDTNVNNNVNEEKNFQNFSFYYKNNDIYEQLDASRPLSYYDINNNIFDHFDSINTCSACDFYDKFKIYVKFYYELAEDADEYIIKNTFLIGRPIVNHYAYAFYDKRSDKLTTLRYDKEEIKKNKIRRYLSYDSYCNAKNKIYIYEGSNEFNCNTNQSKFYSVDLINNKINLISEKFPNRILHSMIYIPKSYIFIVGGKETKSVLTYVIKEKNFSYEKYPHSLPYELLEPSLIFINSKYLYIFENSTAEFHILRVDLVDVKPFEEIKLRNNNLINIEQKFFGVTKNNKNNKIRFLGGQVLNYPKNSQKKCLTVNYETNKVQESHSDLHPYEFLEKTFIPIKKDTFLQLIEIKNGNSTAITKVINEDLPEDKIK
jgi:hypothetical protein